MFLPSATATACLAAGISYLLLVRSLRWRRYHAIHAKYQGKMHDITPEEAQDIIDVSLHWDMPMLLKNSTAFALFKTYAVPTISKVLDAAGEIKSLDTISKRYADTEILIATWVTCPISGIAQNGAPDPRANIALARVNWLHSHFKISNDDFIFTLSLFILEPMFWAEKYGWRVLSPLEKHAFYVYWAEIGRRLNIKDIPDSFESLRERAKAYEFEKMIPTKTNKEVSMATVEELLYALPKCMKPFGRKVVAATLDDHVRDAMMIPKPHWYIKTIVKSILLSAAFIQKHLLLPRSTHRSPVHLELPNICKGKPVRLHPVNIAARPWYKPQSQGFGHLMDKLRATLGIKAGMPGPHLKSEGYNLQTQGPERFEKDGHEEVIHMAEELQGRPIPEAWKVI